MKKQFLVLGLAVAAMTSCTNDEVLDVQQPVQKAIGFESFVNKETRNVTETNSSIAKFYTFGFYGAGTTEAQKVFQNVEVYKNTNEGWDYTEKKYWTKNKYYFAAYANNNSAVIDETTTQNGKLNDVTFANINSNPTLTISNYEVTDENDLVADVLSEIDNSNYLAYNTPVSFTLNHLLTRVKFRVINTSQEYKMRITTALTVNGAKKTGTCKVVADANGAGATWEPSGSEHVYTPIAVTAVDEYIAKSNDVNNDDQVISQDFFLLPQTLNVKDESGNITSSDVTFTIVADFYDDNNQVVKTKTLTTKAFSIDAWEVGKYYDFTISLPVVAKPIEFGNPTVPGWGTATSVELNGDDIDNTQS